MKRIRIKVIGLCVVVLSACTFLVSVLVVGCALSMPGVSYNDAPAQATDDENDLARRLKKHVVVLSEEIGERQLYSKLNELNKTADYIESGFTQLGYKVSSQYFTVSNVNVRNIEAVKKGGDLADEIIVIGAHYDSAEGTPAANDNGSGVAGMLEMARLMKDDNLPRTVRFVAFVNEEPPYFHSEDMGSLRYAKKCAKNKDDIVAMLSLETIGYYSNEPQSQEYPAALASFYPDTGNFITFVGNLKSRSLVKKCVEIFRETTNFPCEGASLPGTLTGIDWSDHWSFWQAGYDGVMVTDTAIFRYPHYHKTTDTVDKIDFDSMARVTKGLVKVTRRLAR